MLSLRRGAMPGFAVGLAVCLLAAGTAQAQTDLLRRMDINGNVEGVDVAFDDTMLTDKAFPFNNLGFPGGGFGNFPDFGGNVQKFYFELPAGVMSISSLTIFDDHDPSLMPGDPGACVVGGQSFDCFTGPEIHAIEAWDGAMMINADSTVRYIPGERKFSMDPVIIQMTDNLYGNDIVDPDMTACPTYDHIRGTSAGVLPNMTAGLAGTANDLLGPANPNGVWGILQTKFVYDGMGAVTGILDCDSDTVADLAVGPIYPDPAPPGKEPWPGYTTIGCGGTITVNFAAPAVPKAGVGTAGADIVVYEVGFSEEPLTAVGSSTLVGPVNTDTDGGPVLDCMGVPGVDPGTTGLANITITNDTALSYTSGGFPPFGFEFEKYKVRVVDGSGHFADQEVEFLADPISPDAGLNTRTLGPFNVTCQSVFYFYAFGDDGAFGNPDGDGHPEQIFASDIDVTGISFLGFTGIDPEPLIYDPTTLLTAGRLVPVLNGGGAASWSLYAFGEGAPVGSASIATPVEMEMHPRSLNKEAPGNWITVYLETNGDIEPSDLDPSTIVIEGEAAGVGVSAVRWRLGDGDEDGIDDLMLKFPRGEVADLVEVGGHVLFTIKGLTTGGEEFSVQDRIQVFSAGTPRIDRAKGRP